MHKGAVNELTVPCFTPVHFSTFKNHDKLKCFRSKHINKAFYIKWQNLCWHNRNTESLGGSATFPSAMWNPTIPLLISGHWISAQHLQWQELTTWQRNIFPFFRKNYIYMEFTYNIQPILRAYPLISSQTCINPCKINPCWCKHQHIDYLLLRGFFNSQIIEENPSSTPTKCQTRLHSELNLDPICPLWSWLYAGPNYTYTTLFYYRTPSPEQSLLTPIYQPSLFLLIYLCLLSLT